MVHTRVRAEDYGRAGRAQVTKHSVISNWKARSVPGVAVSASMCFATQVCAFLVFVFQLVGHSVVLQEVTYVVVRLLLSMLVLWVHMKASSSRAIRGAQRLLRLADLQTP